MTTNTIKRIQIWHGPRGKVCRLEFAGYEGQWVNMTFSDLGTRRAFQMKTLKTLHQFLDPPPIDELNRLLREAEYIPTSSPLKRVK